LGEKEASRADVILYVVDHTRLAGNEEAKILGNIRKIERPKILVINKIDITQPSYIPFYQPQIEECDDWVKVSALKGTHIKTLLEKIFQFLPKGKPLVDITNLPFPALNLDAKGFIAEIIREKAFLITRKEVPYTLAVKTEEIIERKKGNFYIKAVIYTLADRYKKIIIGHKGKTIKQIGAQARKELETICGKSVYLDLRVETNKHWPETLLI
jgi:GTP-binding protein Era